MIAVCIIGVLASVAMPAFNYYVMSARSGEIPPNMSLIYKGMLAYYARETTSARGVIGATSSGRCITDDGGSDSMPMSPVPEFPLTPYPRTGDWSSAGYRAVGFAPAGPVYGSYAWHGVANQRQCGITEADFPSQLVFIIFGVSDLDGDGLIGGYSLQVGIRGEQLFRQAGFGSVEDGVVAQGIGACPGCGGFVE